MTAVLSRILLWQKFALLGSISALIALVPLTLFLQASSRVTDTVTREVSGLPALRTLLNINAEVQRHRRLTALVLGGNSDAASTRTEKQRDIEISLAVFTEVANTTGNTEIVERWKTAQAAWKDLVGQVEQRTLKPIESYQRHTALIG